MGKMDFTFPKGNHVIGFATIEMKWRDEKPLKYEFEIMWKMARSCQKEATAK
jgi:hypothetical protein